MNILENLITKIFCRQTGRNILHSAADKVLWLIVKVAAVVAVFAFVAGGVGYWLVLESDCPDAWTQHAVSGDSIINTGGEDGPYCVTAILKMHDYEAFVGQTYSDSVEAHNVFDLLTDKGMGHDQKFQHGGWAFRGYKITCIKFNPEVEK